MLHSKPITEIIRTRFSCRSYAPKPIEPEQRARLQEILSALIVGPLGTAARFELAAATDRDWTALKGLGTYGFIRGASGYIIGAVGQGQKNMEDYGYLLERAVLAATDTGLGTCWLGGTFSKSNFVRKISLRPGELVPSVVAIGYVADRRRWFDSFVRRRAGSDHRLPWTELFFDRTFHAPLSSDAAGAYATALEMVRLAPSASNNQPWRIVQEGRKWHFFVRRTKGYGDRNMALFHLADLQRVDVGIAMCHFDLTREELGLAGKWVVSDPNIEKPDSLTEYVVSWEQEN
jgi:nitroreductase